MGKISLKHPLGTYHKRFKRFLWLMMAVRALKPKDQHLWRVMDGVAFQDTETALETALHNEGRTLDMEQSERLTQTVLENERKSRKTRSRRKTANN